MAVYFGKQRCDGMSDSAIQVVRFKADASTGNWCRIWSNGWCEQGGYTCDANGLFYPNVNYVSVYQCAVTLIQPYKNNNYTVFTGAESSFQARIGNYGYDYVAMNTKTREKFNAIMHAFNVNGSEKNYYFRQYWEAKGYINFSEIKI